MSTSCTWRPTRRWPTRTTPRPRCPSRFSDLVVTTNFVADGEADEATRARRAHDAQGRALPRDQERRTGAERALHATDPEGSEDQPRLGADPDVHAPGRRHAGDPRQLHRRGV